MLISSDVRLMRVAPLAGAWIETLPQFRKIESANVAPLAGAWIETVRPEFLRKNN